MTSPEYKTNLVNGQEKIRVDHLNRQAYIYIRQSSAGQVVYHRESQINQEQMADRAYLLGWDPSDVQIIRTDLGISGRDADNRKGFQKLLSEVSLGQVGIIFGYEVSRLARNSSDWYKLLEAAAIFDTLIADYDGVYDLNLFNDRLLLGLKGTMSEAELHLIQLRLVAGRKRQLERGVYRQYLPTGYIRLNDGTVIQDPNEQIRRCFQLIFSKFRQLGSCNKLLAYLREESILIPRRQVSGIHKGETLWKVPAYAALYQILTIPTYAGAMVYGRRQTQRSSTTRLRKPMDQWKYIHQGTYPAYISWDEYIDNQQRLQLNGTIARPVNESTQGASREGAALLQGFVFCGECGQRISIAYKPYGRYVCQMLRRRFGEPCCMMLKADPIDQVVVQAFFEALQPAQLDALTSVLQGYDQEYSQLKQPWHDRIQQARYEAQRAQRFYQAVDPEKRLVAAELERHWETTLHTLQETELAYEEFERQHQPPSFHQS
jgi:DNA invertase Pin-like site-specific DNA recombinase